MACRDIVGDDWIVGLLVVDSTDEVIFDPPLEITDTGSEFRGIFRDDNHDFHVDCDETGSKTVIKFTRTHNDGTTTDYKGTVVEFGDRGTVGIIRGKFKRKTLRQDRTLAEKNGDWETERPT